MQNRWSDCFVRFMLLSVTLVTLFRCAWSPYSDSDWVSLRFYFEGGIKNNSIFSDHAGSLPRDLSGFHCLALNVMGPGIAPSERFQNIDSYLSRLNQGSYCAYRGVTSKMIPIGSNIEADLLVPSGPSRYIQVLGIWDPNGIFCDSSLPFGFVNSSNSNAEIYVLGMIKKDLFKSETVTITNTYDGLSDEQKMQRYFYCHSDFGSASPSPSPSPSERAPVYLNSKYNL